MTEQEFYEKIRAELDKAAADDSQLSAILEKIQSGTADFEDTQKYAERFSKLIGKVLSQNVTAPGSGLNAFAGYQLMKDGHADINQLLAVVQKSLDKQQNLHINPKTAKFRAERAGAVAHSLEARTVSQEVIERRARNAVSNVINSFHDNYIQENAQFRSRAGLRCYVARIGANKCCTWCAQVAGRFEVGSEPADFWRRHDNCTCQISYENNKVHQRLTGVRHTRPNGQTYERWDVTAEYQRRRAQRIQYKPTVFTPEQARELEVRKLSQYRGLTIPGKTDILETVRYFGNGSNINDGENPMISSSKKEKPSYYPSEIAGVKRGKAMSFEEANHMMANPNFSKAKEYKNNCQTCVVAFEARLRGYDVEAKPNLRHSVASIVSSQTNLPWIDPSTGKNPDYIYDETANNARDFLKFIEKTVNQGERYTIGFSRILNDPHIISLDRTENGELRLYDPQNGRSYTGIKLSLYLQTIKYTHRDGNEFNQRYDSPQLLRVDNAYFNLSIVDKLLKRKET